MGIRGSRESITQRPKLIQGDPKRFLPALSLVLQHVHPAVDCCPRGNVHAWDRESASSVHVRHTPEDPATGVLLSPQLNRIMVLSRYDTARPNSLRVVPSVEHKEHVIPWLRCVLKHNIKYCTAANEVPDLHHQPIHLPDPAKICKWYNAWDCCGAPTRCRYRGCQECQGIGL